jgi:hypothetical protein
MELLYIIMRPPTLIFNVIQWLQPSRGLNLRKVEISARMAG